MQACLCVLFRQLSCRRPVFLRVCSPLFSECSCGCPGSRTKVTDSAPKASYKWERRECFALVLGAVALLTKRKDPTLLIRSASIGYLGATRATAQRWTRMGSLAPSWPGAFEPSCHSWSLHFLTTRSLRFPFLRQCALALFALALLRSTHQFTPLIGSPPSRLLHRAKLPHTEREGATRMVLVRCRRSYGGFVKPVVVRFDPPRSHLLLRFALPCSCPNTHQNAPAEGISDIPPGPYSYLPALLVCNCSRSSPKGPSSDIFSESCLPYRRPQRFRSFRKVI